MTDATPRLQLRRNEDRRLRRGHHWVYSNEVDTAATPLKNFAPGQQAILVDSRGAPLGRVHVNPHTLICARMLDRDVRANCDGDWLLARLRRALALRERLYAEPYYRLVYGDSDSLSGLVIDRFGDYLVVQIGTAGMELMKDALLGALQQLLSPRGVLWRNDSSVRELEGLPREVVIAAGEVPEELELVENGGRFLMSPIAGQKTGWFYDHRDNRARLAELSRDCRVLDVFSYVGAWGVQAATAGAREVLCVDSSEAALAMALRNAELNGVGDHLDTHCGDATASLRALIEAGEKFDVVVLDPPALIKRRKDVKTGQAAYRRFNQDAMRLLNPDGILVSASCSMHLDEDAHADILRAAAQKSGRHLQLFGRGGQGADHPVHPAIAETRYLKAQFCRVI